MSDDEDLEQSIDEAELEFVKHFLDPKDGYDSCVCGQCVDDDGGPTWDRHLIEVLVDQGWRPGQGR